jgi:hypothetical protein
MTHRAHALLDAVEGTIKGSKNPDFQQKRTNARFLYQQCVLKGTMIPIRHVPPLFEGVWHPPEADAIPTLQPEADKRSLTLSKSLDIVH